MQNVIISLVILFFLTPSLQAMCLYEEMDPVCAITGETFTHSCAGWSDTSAWHILTAYEGKCKTTQEISKLQKDSIYSFMDSFYTKHDMYDTKRVQYNALNTEGIKFTQFKLFPKIQEIISIEIQKSDPNFQKIASLNYVVQVIWYDYEVTKP